MEKRISFDEFQSVKRVAQACNPLKVKRDKVKSKMEALQKEYNSYDAQISALEAGIKNIIGFRVEELVKKVIEPGTDKNGNLVKTTKYIPTSIVTYDKDKKQYVISVPDHENTGTTVDSNAHEESSTAVNKEPQINATNTTAQEFFN